MRHFIFLLMVLFLSGCIQARDLTESTDEETVVEPLPPDRVDPPSPVPSELPPLSVGVPKSTFETIKAFTENNDSGIQFVGENPLTFTRPEGTLRVPVGSRMFWKTSDTEIVFTFKEPKPDVKAKVWSVKVDPYLVQIRVYPDDSVQADVEGKLYSKTLTYNLTDIKTKPKVGEPGATDLPQVWCWSCTTNCTKESKRQADLAKAEFDANIESLGFIPVWKDGPPPSWMPSGRPAFWIPVSQDVPGDGETNRRYLIGYTNLQQFLATFRATRALKVSAAASRGTPFAQPDRSGGSNTLTYNASHNCPRCGRQQLDIENENGPGSNTHIHKCDSCGTQWYHADAARSSRKSGWWFW